MSNPEIKEQIEANKKLLFAIFYGIAAVILIATLAVMVLVDKEGRQNGYLHWASLLDLLPEISGSIIIGITVSLTLQNLLRKNNTLKMMYEQQLEDTRHANQKQEEEERVKNIGIENQNLIEDLTNKTREEIHQLLNGFREIKVTDVFNKAKTYVKNSSTIRVIGTAKQEYSDGEANTVIREYLEETIRRLERSNLKYRRITSLDMNPKFFNHIKKVFETNKDNHDAYLNNCEIQILDDFVPAYTYLIIDDKFLMLSLNYSEQPHNTFHYYTESKTIIDRFTLHFISVWNRERNFNKIISNVDDFISYFKYRKLIQNSFNEIKRAIRKFPNQSTLYQSHALTELDLVAKAFSSLSRNEISVKFQYPYNNLINLLCLYLDNLKAGDRYETITFCKFWKNATSPYNTESDFEGKHDRSLKKGVKIKRILVINRSTDFVEHFKYDFGKIIDLHMRLFEENQEFYDFKILIVDEVNKLHEDFYHFALMYSQGNAAISNERILFEPVNTNYNSSVKIWFDIVESAERVNRDTFNKFQEKEWKLKEISDLWNQGKLIDDDAKFIEDILSNTFVENKLNLVAKTVRSVQDRK